MSVMPLKYILTSYPCQSPAFLRKLWLLVCWFLFVFTILLLHLFTLFTKDSQSFLTVITSATFHKCQLARSTHDTSAPRDMLRLSNQFKFKLIFSILLYRNKEVSSHNLFQSHLSFLLCSLKEKHVQNVQLRQQNKTDQHIKCKTSPALKYDAFNADLSPMDPKCSDDATACNLILISTRSAVGQ